MEKYQSIHMASSFLFFYISTPSKTVEKYNK
nr:MAG TPA: hypothetical protein [Caudoviricetes sp.]